FATFDRNRRADQEPMLDIKARPAELADMGREFDDIAKARRREKAGTGIDQRQAGNAERRPQIRRLHAERGLEQQPRAPIENLKKPAVEDDAGGIAMAPLDGKAPAADEFGHQNMIARKRGKRQLSNSIGGRQKSCRASLRSPVTFHALLPAQKTMIKPA